MAEVAACSTIHPWTIVDQGGASGDCITTTRLARTGWCQRRRLRCRRCGIGVGRGSKRAEVVSICE
eukprot:5407901-Prymnesium_polylepis.1